MRRAAVLGQTLKFQFEYGHFFTEVLPQFVRLYLSVSKDVPILYFSRNSKRHNVTDRVLRAFFEYGMWDPSRFVIVEDRGSVFVDELYVAPCFKSAAGMREMGEFFAANYARRMASGGILAPKKRSDGLLVVFQKRKKKGRRWENSDLCEDTVESLATSRSLPVEVTRDEGHLSISQVIALYEAVHVTVGPHGAGIASAVFMRPGSAVIEFCHMGADQYWRPDCRWFGDDLRAMGHRVISLLCKDCRHNGPMRVDHLEVAELVLHLAATLKVEQSQ